MAGEPAANKPVHGNMYFGLTAFLLIGMVCSATLCRKRSREACGWFGAMKRTGILFISLILFRASGQEDTELSSRWVVVPPPTWSAMRSTCRPTPACPPFVGTEAEFAHLLHSRRLIEAGFTSGPMMPGSSGRATSPRAAGS